MSYSANNNPLPQFCDIVTAQSVLKNIVKFTPLERSKSFSAMSGAEVYLKLENFQTTGSFKVRGAYYKKKYMKKVDAYLKEHDDKMIFIYGEYNSWSSTAYEPGKGVSKALKIVKPGGSHTTRINNLPETQRQQVLDSLERWLNVKIERE